MKTSTNLPLNHQWFVIEAGFPLGDKGPASGLSPHLLRRVLFQHWGICIFKNMSIVVDWVKNELGWSVPSHPCIVGISWASQGGTWKNHFLPSFLMPTLAGNHWKKCTWCIANKCEPKSEDDTWSEGKLKSVQTRFCQCWSPWHFPNHTFLTPLRVKVHLHAWKFTFLCIQLF